MTDKAERNNMRIRNARRTDQDMIDGAHRIERAAYWHEIKDVAKEACGQIKDEGRDENDVIHELVDGHEYIIYSGRLTVLRFTRNDDAWQDAGAELGDDPISVMSYYAMMQDVHDELDCEGSEEDED